MTGFWVSKDLVGGSEQLAGHDVPLLLKNIVSCSITFQKHLFQTDGTGILTL